MDKIAALLLMVLLGLGTPVVAAAWTPWSVMLLAGMAAMLAGVVLAVVTIGSHRAHTAAVITRTEANDQWAFYQAKKLREHLLEVGVGLASSLAPEPSRVQRGS